MPLYAQKCKPKKSVSENGLRNNMQLPTRSAPAILQRKVNLAFTHSVKQVILYDSVEANGGQMHKREVDLEVKHLAAPRNQIYRPFTLAHVTISGRSFCYCNRSDSTHDCRCRTGRFFDKLTILDVIVRRDNVIFSCTTVRFKSSL